MSEQLPVQGEEIAFKLPEFKSLPAVKLVMNNVKVAESRLHEAQHANPATYSELEHCFGESYRDLQKHLGTVGAHILKAKTMLDKAKGVALMDKFPEYLKDKPKSMNNAAVRDAFVGQDEDVAAITDHLDTLMGLELLLEGRVKVMENVCRWMRKRMDMIIRSGVDPDFFIRAKR
jgi:hypothetical protein